MQRLIVFVVLVIAAAISCGFISLTDRLLAVEPQEAPPAFTNFLVWSDYGAHVNTASRLVWMDYGVVVE